jgi:hypothetical protein
MSRRQWAILPSWSDNDRLMVTGGKQTRSRARIPPWLCCVRAQTWLSLGAAISASVDRAAPAAVRAEQRLGQRSLLDVLNAEREPVEPKSSVLRRGGIWPERAARLWLHETAENLAERSRDAARRRPANQGRSAQYGHGLGPFRRHRIAPIRLRTNILVRKTPFNRQILTAIVWSLTDGAGGNRGMSPCSGSRVLCPQGVLVSGPPTPCTTPG